MTVCKDFQCEKQNVCLYGVDLKNCDGYLYSRICDYRICESCRIRQTCSAYRKETLSQQKSRQKKSAKK